VKVLHAAELSALIYSNTLSEGFEDLNKRKGGFVHRRNLWWIATMSLW